MGDLELKRAQKRQMMLEGNLLKVIPIVAMPMVLSMLIDGLYNLADTYFVSQLGISATAAVGVNDAVLHLMRAVAMGFGMGASSYISRLMGAKKEDEASKVTTTTIISAIIVLTAISAIAFIFKEQMVMLFGATETSKQYAVDYAKFILISAPFTACEVTCSNTLRGEGSTTYSMIGMVSGCVINVALDPIFINVLDMGVGGAALATTISKGISAVVLLSPFLRKKTLTEFKLSNFTPKWSIYKEIAKMGVPTVIRISVMSFSSILMNNIAGDFSDAALAAVSVSNKITRLCGSAIMGFGQGFQPIAGYCYGARKYKRVREGYWTCTAIGAALALIIGGGMFFFANQLIGVFAKGDAAVETISIGARMVKNQCLTMFFHVWVMIVNGLYQALGKPVESLVLGLSRQVICLVPCLLVLPRIWGIPGLTWTQSCADTMSFIICLLMVFREMKFLKGLTDGEPVPQNKKKS